MIGRRITQLGLLLMLSALGGLAPLPAEAADCVRPGKSEMTVEPWAQTRLGVSGLADTFQGWEVTIAVIGSGVDASHPQLAGHVTEGIAIGSGTKANEDCFGTGTATAGAAAAAPVSGSTVRGLAPQAVVVPIRLPEKFATPNANISERDAAAAEAALLDALKAAAEVGAKIVVLPELALIGTDKLRNAIAEADQSGMLLIQGIPQNLTASQAYPLAYPEVLGVLAMNIKGELAKTSAPENLQDLAAPGTEALVLAPGKGYTQGSGNYVAAGFTAGSAALLLDAGKRTTPASLRKQLIASGIRSPGISGPPLLSPAAALGPIAKAAEVDDAVAGGELITQAKQTPDFVPSLAVATALFWVSGLALSAWAAAALVRGRRRRWIPADHNKPFKPAESKSLTP